MRTKFILLLVFALSVLSTTQAYAFKTKMHIRTANMAILDAMDGGICLPGLTKTQAGKEQLPPQVPLGNTLLQHFFSSYRDDTGKVTDSPNVTYRTYLLQYAPYIRAGAIGPDGFPDMVSGQLFVHANNAVPYECLNANNGECTSLHTRDVTEIAVPDYLSKPIDNKYVDILFQFHPTRGSESSKPFNRTFSGYPQWRSVDWAHEVLYRALKYHDERLLKNGVRNSELSGREYKVLMEDKRAAVAFALGYFMHMVGDGNIHSVINNLVAMPWSYLGTRMEGNPVYGPLSVMQEELQHMALERYFSDLYAPGSEPASRMKHLDGLMCEPYVKKENIRSICLKEEDALLPPMPCNLCNPLRSANPSEMSGRCDHCYVECNPWKEICAPQLGLSVVCPVKEVCPNYKAELDQCKQDPVKQQSCIRQVQLKCTDNREKCLCDKGVKVLTELEILKPEHADLTCKSTQGKSLSQEAQDQLDQYQDVATRAVDDSLLPASMKETLTRNIQGWSCDQRPIDQHHMFLSNYLPGGRHTVEVPKREDETKPMPEYERISYDKHGYVLDINENGQADLINECILINCQFNPSTCPWSALDRDTPESHVVDALFCQEDALGAKSYGPAPDSHSRCDSGLQSPTSIYVKPQEVLNAYDAHRSKIDNLSGEDKYPEELELFINSTYIAIPKNFVAQVFYLDRQYTQMPPRAQFMGQDPKPWTAADFEPTRDKGTPGTFSLGGPVINLFHALSDSLDAMATLVQSSITEPVEWIKSTEPNNLAIKYLQSAPPKILAGVEFLRRFARACAKSNLLNFDIIHPITKRILARVDIGKRIAQGMYIVADHLEVQAKQMENYSGRLAWGLTRGLYRRVHRLNEHIRTKWPNTNVCMAEAITTGYSRFYGVGQIVQFVHDGFQIVLSGGVACQKPQLVDTLINKDIDQISWDMTLVEDVGAAQGWMLCEMERALMKRFFRQVLWPMFVELFDRIVNYYMCSIVGIPADVKNMITDTFSQISQTSTIVKQINAITGDNDKTPSLEALCNEAAALMFAPSRGLNPLVEYTISNSMLTLDTTPEVTLGDFYKNMRVITKGTCWDGGGTNVHLSARDRLRASFGDFAFKDRAGDNRLCQAHGDWFSAQTNGFLQKYPDLMVLQTDPVWGPWFEAAAGVYGPKKREIPSDWTSEEKAKVEKPAGAYRYFYKPDARGLYPPEEFELRAGPPIVRALDRMMQAPDPYSRKLYKQRKYSHEEKKVKEDAIHLMNSVAFEPTYNTVQINKLTFLGPGTPGTETCQHDFTECLKEDGSFDDQKCARLKDRCKPEQLLKGDAETNAINDDYGRGVFSLMIFGNKFKPDEVGSGQYGWRSPLMLFHDLGRIDTGGGEDALRAFFQEDFLSPHDYSISHPGHRTCKDLDYNVMCNFIYDLDDPDDYCRQAHGWMYDLMMKYPKPPPKDMSSDMDSGDMSGDMPPPNFGSELFDVGSKYDIDWWPNVTQIQYRFTGRQDKGNYWQRYSHDHCVWLKKLDNAQLHKAGYVNQSYAPDPLNLGYIPNYKDRQFGILMRPAQNVKWSYTEHARDYLPSKRWLFLDGVYKAYDEDQSLVDDANRILPTRFSLANKYSHVERLYSKVVYKHHCPLQEDSADQDCDGIPDLCDNCPNVYNPTQKNTSNRSSYRFEGDACAQGGVGVVLSTKNGCAEPSKEQLEKEGVGGCGNCDCSHTPSKPDRYLWLMCLVLLVGIWRKRDVL